MALNPTARSYQLSFSDMDLLEEEVTQETTPTMPTIERESTPVMGSRALTSGNWVCYVCAVYKVPTLTKSGVPVCKSCKVKYLTEEAYDEIVII